MNFPDDFNGTNMDNEPSIESERADEELQQIVDYKRDLLNLLETQRQDLRKGAQAMREVVEESFDEAFCAQWCDLTAKSGSCFWPTHIPSFETLSFETPKEKADREYRKARIQATRGTAPQNPATIIQRGDDL